MFSACCQMISQAVLVKVKSLNISSWVDMPSVSQVLQKARFHPKPQQFSPASFKAGREVVLSGDLNQMLDRSLLLLSIKAAGKKAMHRTSPS